MKNDRACQRENAEESETMDASMEMEGFALLFGLTGRVFYTYPDFAWVNGLIAEGTFEEIPEVCSNRDMHKGQDLILKWCGENREGLSKEAFEALQVDYVRLFIGGNGSVLAPPWESVYVNSVPTLFQQSTMNVRTWYKRYDLVVENLNHEPDDHVGLEFSFVSHLCSIVSNCTKASDEVRSSTTMQDLSEFASHHVFTWVPRWCDLVADQAETDFFRGIALFSKGVTTGFAKALKADVETEVFR